MTSTLLVTGGCGFIGSNFIRGFLKSHPEWAILNLDKLSYCGNIANTDDFAAHPRYRFIQGDIGDAKLLNSFLSQVHAVINFAAETHVDRSIESSADFLQTNILGTGTLLEAAKRVGIKRFIQISTDEVYGSVKHGAADEDGHLKPNSPYSASKAAADLLVRSYWKTYQYPAIIVRSTNNFGPYQFPEKVIPLFITNLFDGKKVPLYGNGQNRRQWIYVEDNCRAIETVFDHGEPFQIYNISAGNEMTNETLAKTILKVMGKTVDSIQPVKDRPGHDFRYSVKTDKIKKIGFRPKWKFDEGLRSTIAWYQSNPDWWQPLKADKFTVK